MAGRLAFKRRVRMPETLPIEEEPRPIRRGPRIVGAILAWSAFTAGTWSVSAGKLRVADWLDASSGEPSAVASHARERDATRDSTARAATARPVSAPAPNTAPSEVSEPERSTDPLAAAESPTGEITGPSSESPLATEAPADTTASPEPAAAPPAAAPPSEATAPSSAAPAPAPANAGNLTCEGAIAGYREEVRIGSSSAPADITRSQYGAVLENGAYFAHCGVPDTVRVTICAAVRNGRAVGVTVDLSPPNARLRGCIAGAVRAQSFPSHPKLDVTTTVFEAVN